jgi:hypothetical protein
LSDADRPAPEASDGSGDPAPETAYPTPEATAARTDGCPSAPEAAALGCGIGRYEKSARSQGAQRDEKPVHRHPAFSPDLADPWDWAE